jgi:hypothetical protein
MSHSCTFPLPSPNGPTCEGTCAGCGDTRTFYNSLPISYNPGRHPVNAAAKTSREDSKIRLFQAVAETWEPR